MPTLQGFFELKTPADLLGKVERDLARMEKDPTDSDAAFDFFVTAEHVLDWKYPDSQSPKNYEMHRKPLHQSVLELGLTWDLASGAKHFEVTRSGHESILSVQVRQGAFDPAFFSSLAFDTGSLDIETAGKATALGSRITALDLARRVVQYWKQHLSDP